jgi:hypothetical protein
LAVCDVGGIGDEYELFLLLLLLLLLNMAFWTSEAES